MRRSGRYVAITGMIGLVSASLCGAGARAQQVPSPDLGAPMGQSAQDGAEARHRGGEFAGMGRVMGEVSAVAGSTLTVETEDGRTLQVVTTDNTRVMKDRGPVKAADLHVGDGLMALGNLDAPNRTLHAAVVMAEDAATIKSMKENLGKTYITGRVTAVDLDNARMTVERADRVSQTIGFDESTSFKRAVRGSGGGEGSGGPGRGGDAGNGRGMGGFGGGMAMAMGSGIDRAFSNGESITLADIKPGDFVAGTGTIKGGTFVPTRVVDSPPRRPHSNGTTPHTPDAGAATTPGPGQP